MCFVSSARTPRSRSGPETATTSVDRVARLTPFRTLQEMDFCMPKHIADAAETTINALIYAKEHTSDVFDEVPLFFKQFQPEIHI